MERVRDFEKREKYDFVHIKIRIAIMLVKEYTSQAIILRQFLNSGSKVSS